MWDFDFKGVGGFIFATQCPTICRSRHHSARGEARESIQSAPTPPAKMHRLQCCQLSGMGADYRPKSGAIEPAYEQHNAGLWAALIFKKNIYVSPAKLGIANANRCREAPDNVRADCKQANMMQKRSRALMIPAKKLEAARGRCGRLLDG